MNRNHSTSSLLRTLAVSVVVLFLLIWLTSCSTDYILPPKAIIVKVPE